ncbi:ferredoxin family protein [uncultured Adlercreutzia sp.]|uniref:4Fe-4S dicluster domain-containing protein n=1 Tax=uncultured Adlercreutzia sp. TaxID=875803 RepID=UPI002666BFC8|nr:4Fe-4S binding protein [uncultured Adlercreutzia sp.]
MTNYRHGQMINLIDEMNSPLLAVEPQRCVLVRHRNGECLRCAAVCTTGAISLGEEGIVVSPEKCIGCGTCASACPTGCLTAANPTDEELFGAVEAALAENEGRVAIACERAFAMASGNRMKRDSCDATAPSFVPGKIAGATSDGRPLVGVVCLGRVDESLLVEATARGARSIQLISGPCESCPHRCGGALSDEIIVSAETLLAALGTPSPIDRIRLQHASDTREILRLRPTASAQDDTANATAAAEVSGDMGRSDRASSADGIEGGLRKGMVDLNAFDASEDCLSESGYPVAPPTGESQQDSREPQFAHVQADGTLPHFVPERRLRLFNSLKALGTPAAPTVTTRLWGQVTIDTELCRSCRMCTVFCPTGALTRFDAANDAFGVEHRSALCMQCRLCETICPEQAITVAEEVSADEFLSGKKFRFTMQPIGWNPGAEDSIASRMARFIKVDNLQEPQAKVKSFDTAARREYAQAREARRREIREQHSS